MVEEKFVVLDIIFAQVLVSHQIICNNVLCICVERTDHEERANRSPNDIHEHPLRGIQILCRRIHLLTHLCSEKEKTLLC